MTPNEMIAMALGSGLVLIGTWLAWRTGLEMGERIGRRDERRRIAHRRLADNDPALWTWRPEAGRKREPGG